MSLHRVTDTENTLMVTQGKGREKGYMGRLGLIYIYYYYKITKKSLLYSTGNSTQYFTVNYMGKEAKKRVNTCVYITDSLCCTAEINTPL